VTPHSLGRAVAASISILAAACGPMRADPNSIGPEPAVVYFTNESLDQADVYAITSTAQRTRIGTVMAGRTEALAIPGMALGSGSVNVVARLLARAGYVGTGQFNLQPGDRYSIRLPSDGRVLVILPARQQDLQLRVPGIRKP
jgi:hypothetical protein